MKVLRTFKTENQEVTGSWGKIQFLFLIIRVTYLRNMRFIWKGSSYERDEKGIQNLHYKMFSGVAR
jgi:hypothetical protein